MRFQNVLCMGLPLGSSSLSDCKELANQFCFCFCLFKGLMWFLGSLLNSVLKYFGRILITYKVPSLSSLSAQVCSSKHVPMVQHVSGAFSFPSVQHQGSDAPGASRKGVPMA